MFNKRSSKDDENRYIDLIAHYSGYNKREILEAARTKASAYNESILYLLRVWEGKAYAGSFNLDRERY